MDTQIDSPNQVTADVRRWVWSPANRGYLDMVGDEYRGIYHPLPSHHPVDDAEHQWIWAPDGRSCSVWDGNERCGIYYPLWPPSTSSSTARTARTPPQVWGLLCGLVDMLFFFSLGFILGPLGIILGLSGLDDDETSSRGLRGLAVASIVLGVLGILGFLMLLIVIESNGGLFPL